MKSLFFTLHTRAVKLPFFYSPFALSKRLSLSLVFVVLVFCEISAQTRLGLHFTQQELDIWRKRANVGPYKHFGYESTSSPADWDRITSNAKSFLSNPSAERYKGVSTGSCVQVGASEPTNNGKKLRDAAFVYLITGDISYRNAVRNELIAQSSEANANFAVRSRWCTNLGDAPPAYPIASWLTRLLFAYDYIKSTLSDSDRNKLDKWFYDAAIFLQLNVDQDLGKYYVNRSSDNYTLSEYAHMMSASYGRTTHYNGYKTSSIGRAYNNRRSAQVKYFALVGIMQNASVLKNSGKRYVKEMLMYSIYPDGTSAEFQRWTEGFPDAGWSYVSHSIFDAVDVADHFARAGDAELYRFTTSQGAYGTSGGTKNLALVVNHVLNYVDGTVRRYGTASSGNQNTNYQINNIDEGDGWFAINELWFSKPNLYFKNDRTKKLYTRTASNVKPYPSGPAGSGPHVPFGGSWDTYPGMLFMFGQMENKVWPYVNISNPSSLQSDPNANNTITVSAYGKNSPKFRVIVNGIIVGDVTASSSVQNLKFTTKFSLSDIKTVMIHHYNDDTGKDLFINSITVGSQNIKANASNVKYDKFNIDGKDIINGQTAMLWNGALVFKPSGYQNDEDPVEEPAPSNGTTVTVKAYSTISSGVYGHFKVMIKGTVIGEAYTTNSLKDYTFTSDWNISDLSQVVVHYDNDRNANGEDRNLFVKSIVVNGVEISSTSSSVKFDRYALDGKDVMAGRVDLLWAGYLVYNLPNSLTDAIARQDFSVEGGDPELSKITDVIIAPNPNPGVFTLFVEMNAETDVALVVMDMIGNVLYEETYPSVSYQLDEKIELPELPAGMYLVKVLVGNESVIKKFVKQ
ncbi:T9SS type A sorting domain-containing protein [Rhodocytophaga rosea]|uniref:T9SS type A sorting domain-containing protein n=1 Tax=Rhodocytophaga rosea TaxID=2704465 RepID=A0A6C0GWA8_9BACT|nr:carbohydrate-binding domain-containing protein [Rhodocytophaga rosea]QHT71622.1 T9SS type A sorting domain-containing protein [Rhodocytophaga rosea]